LSKIKKLEGVVYVKRNRIMQLIIICVLALTFSAGSAFAVTFMSIGTGSTGGTFYPVGVILSNVFNEELQSEGYKFSAQASGGSTENLEMIRNQEIQMAVCGSVPAGNAYQGIDVYEGKEIKNVRFLTALWPEAVQLMYRKDSGIESLADFEGKKVSVGPAAGGGVFYMPIILDAYNGMSFDDFDAQYLGYSDSVQALQNGLIDACYLASGLPTSAVSQLYAGQVDVGMIEFTDEEAARIVEAAPFFTPVTIPAETYSKQKEPLHTIAIKSSFIIDAEIDEELVYKMLDALYLKHIDNVRDQHGALKFVTLDEATKGLSGAPLHAGAVKFYQDQGIEVPDHLIPPEMK
jgi:hypothetical protein